MERRCAAALPRRSISRAKFVPQDQTTGSTDVRMDSRPPRRDHESCYALTRQRAAVVVLAAIGLAAGLGANSIFDDPHGPGRGVSYVLSGLFLVGSALTLYRGMWRVRRSSPRS